MLDEASSPAAHVHHPGSLTQTRNAVHDRVQPLFLVSGAQECSRKRACLHVLAACSALADRVGGTVQARFICKKHEQDNTATTQYTFTICRHPAALQVVTCCTSSSTLPAKTLVMAGLLKKLLCCWLCSCLLLLPASCPRCRSDAESDAEAAEQDMIREKGAQGEQAGLGLSPGKRARRGNLWEGRHAYKVATNCNSFRGIFECVFVCVCLCVCACVCLCVCVCVCV